MEKRKSFYWLIAFLLGISILVMARKAQEQLFAAGSPNATFSIIDKNGDGFISREEYDEYRVYFDGRTFDSLDFYGNGYLSLPELQSEGIPFAQVPPVRFARPGAKKTPLAVPRKRPDIKRPRARVKTVKPTPLRPTPVKPVPAAPRTPLD